MRIIIFGALLSILLTSFASAQVAFVISDSAGTILNNVDQDSIYFILPAGVLPRQIGSDTTKAAVTVFKPPEYARTSGFFTLWLNRTYLAGTPDSFRVWFHPIHPITGAPAKNDSTFLIGTASTFGNGDTINNRRYEVVISGPDKGIMLVIRQGDLAGSRRTRIVSHLVYTQ